MADRFINGQAFLGTMNHKTTMWGWVETTRKGKVYFSTTSWGDQARSCRLHRFMMFGWWWKYVEKEARKRNASTKNWGDSPRKMGRRLNWVRKTCKLDYHHNWTHSRSTKECHLCFLLPPNHEFPHWTWALNWMMFGVPSQWCDCRDPGSRDSGSVQSSDLRRERGERTSTCLKGSANKAASEEMIWR